MSNPEEFEGDIEFLDEDADIVQQCVLNVDKKAQLWVTEPVAGIQVENNLLVESVDETQERLRRKRKQPTAKDDDPDYDPTEEITLKSRKRRSFVPQNELRLKVTEFIPKSEIKKDRFCHKMDLEVRRKLQLRVPDYNDPLCLPVRSVNKDYSEQKKLKNWNNLCLDHFKNHDTLLRVNKKPTVASKRITVLKNIHNRISGKVETTISYKLLVENKDGEKRTADIQSVLPKYREKKLLNVKSTGLRKQKAIYTKEEVIISKEIHKDEESLVVYKPKESLSLVYKMFENKDDEGQVDPEDDPGRKHLKEVASCKLCAPCFQTSWRAHKITNNKKVLCVICNRPCISMYNMLAHVKSHPPSVVRAYKKEIAMCLASVVEYHYRCRICHEKFHSIKALRLHVKNHKGKETFKCEVCNQTVTPS
ncbi:RE1-silencing transcription factor A [Bicyclus anynana]|uniref:RE1-silencing transcription factor A n=1 Tax=Bicyclus anynana TaxID=110368 RepID=A0A6J1NP59_BICAN|nr:RE1-silencing transcription factor A [Bicyclus anynana]